MVDMVTNKKTTTEDDNNTIFQMKVRQLIILQLKELEPEQE